MSEEGKNAYGRLTQKGKRTQSIIPDLLMSSHTEGSPIAPNGQQMYELKRVHGANQFNRGNGLVSGLNQFYRTREVTHPICAGSECQSETDPQGI